VENADATPSNYADKLAKIIRRHGMRQVELRRVLPVASGQFHKQYAALSQFAAAFSL